LENPSPSFDIIGEKTEVSHEDEWRVINAEKQFFCNSKKKIDI
jgi:hypothetical protein